MLWERADPGDALTSRFGFPSAVAAATWVTETLDARWGIAVDRCDELVISGWNAMAWCTAGDRRLIAKWSAVPMRFGRLRDAASVTVWLEACGIPVAAPISAIDGRRLTEEPGRHFLLGVLPVLDGHLLDVGDERHVVDAGEMLAAVHDALAAYPEPVEGRRRSGKDQLVHNDFRSANVLHDGVGITGVLDLEDITFDTRLADLAKAAVLLATRYRDWAPTAADVRATFIHSYASCVPLTAQDHRELDARMTAVLAANGWA